MSLYLDDGDVRLYQGDALDVLHELPDESIDCCMTSPPYYGLRDYGVDGQIGLEPTPAEFVARLVDVFREVRRVLAPHGTCWVNLGDSYAGSWGNQGRKPERGTQRPINGEMLTPVLDGRYPDKGSNTGKVPEGVKPKDLLGVPWRVALALQDDGWWLRSDVIWSKPNPMPESVTDRPTRSHEYVFLLTKAPRYYFDAEAVREANVSPEQAEHTARYSKRYSAYDEGTADLKQPGNTNHKGIHARGGATVGRNIRSVWEIATHPYPEAHFATFPPALVERCVAAGCPERVCRTCGEPSRRVVERTAMVVTPGPGRIAKQAENGDRARTAVGGTMTQAPTSVTTGWTDCGHDDYRAGVVLDPFSGSGTTAHVARRMGRHAVGIDMNPEYLALAARRLQQLSLLGGVA